MNIYVVMANMCELSLFLLLPVVERDPINDESGSGENLWQWCFFLEMHDFLGWPAWYFIVGRLRIYSRLAARVQHSSDGLSRGSRCAMSDPAIALT